MNTDPDPNLMAFFAQAEQEFDKDSFVAGVMGQIDRERRKTVLVWLVLGLFTIACFVALAAPVITAVGMATELLPVSLVEIRTEWVRQLVSPINSVAAITAVIVLGVTRFFRGIFR
jgi:hypothetical protein